jgi:hypothetical protein
MSLKFLAPELIFMIAVRLDVRSLASLVVSCRAFHSLLTRELLHRALEFRGGADALSHAARIDSLSLARALLSIGADPNGSYECAATRPGPLNYVALHYAALQGNIIMVRLFLEHGANLERMQSVPPAQSRSPPFRPDREYLDEMTALGCAVCHNDAVLTEFLLDEREARGITNDCFEGECSQLFDLAIEEGLVDIVRVFLARDLVDPVALGWMLRKPIHAGNAEIADMIIMAGADVEAQPSTWRPLHSAAHEGHSKVVEVLLRHGAEVDALSHATGDQPKTPLVVAAKTAAFGPSEYKVSWLPWDLREEEAQRCQQGAQEAMCILVDWGADVDWAIHLTHGLRISGKEKETMIGMLQTIHPSPKSNLR